MDRAGAVSISQCNGRDVDCGPPSLALPGTSREDLVAGQDAYRGPGDLRRPALAHASRSGLGDAARLPTNDRRSVEDGMTARGIPFDVNPPPEAGERP